MLWRLLNLPNIKKDGGEIVLGIGRAATREVNPENLDRLVSRYMLRRAADDTLRERIDTRKTPEDRILELIRKLCPIDSSGRKSLNLIEKGRFTYPKIRSKNKETAVTFNKVVRDIISEGQYTRKSELISIFKALWIIWLWR